MEKKLFIGGLAYSTTKEGLAEAFGQAGTVEDAVVIMDRATNRSKGFGFVTMSTPEEAKAAIEMWDGKELEGRSVKVSEARPMRDSR
ncbi:MAG: RNA recognition motif domain-containing protein [Candidatus Komeilibacteria bacterium]